MRNLGIFRVSALLLLFFSGYAISAQSPATIQGHVNNPVGQPIPNAVIKLTTDRRPSGTDRIWQYSFLVDEYGNYSQRGIAPGDYVAVVFSKGKSIDYNLHVLLFAGEEKVINFDMTRKEYIDKMTPNERAELEAYKRKLAAQSHR